MPTAAAKGKRGKTVSRAPLPARHGGASERRAPRGFTLVELLVVIAIIGILIALLLPAVQAAREAARRMQCSNNLRQIGVAVLVYESHYDVFPVNICFGNDSGVRESGYSWLIGILPFLEYQPLFDSMVFEGSVDEGLGMVNPKNHQAIRTQVPTYYCPSDTAQQDIPVKTNLWGMPGGFKDLPFATTNYSGIMGPHNIDNSSIFGGLPDCHDFSSTGTKECTGTFWRHSHLTPVTPQCARHSIAATCGSSEVHTL